MPEERQTVRIDEAETARARGDFERAITLVESSRVDPDNLQLDASDNSMISDLMRAWRIYVDSKNGTCKKKLDSQRSR